MMHKMKNTRKRWLNKNTQMKIIIGLSIAALLIIALSTGGTYAFFTDTETPSNNQFSVGTLDLKTNNLDGVTKTLYTTSMAPGGYFGPSAIQLRNAGSLDGSTLNIAFTYVESDGSPNSVNKSADDTAAMIEVTTLSYDGSSLLGSVTDANANGYKDLQDLKNANLNGQSGINASATKNFQIAVQLRSSTGNDYDADGIDLTMTFTLNQ